MNAESPCVNICHLDANDVCVGCLRTRDEIARWSRMSDTEKVSVLIGLDGRRVVPLKRKSTTDECEFSR
jgi:predicted Fe-S protein YdhL (DUF1289 family)